MNCFKRHPNIKTHEKLEMQYRCRLLFSQCIPVQKKKTILSSQGKKFAERISSITSWENNAKPTILWRQAAPSEEMLKEYSNPKPYKGKTLCCEAGEHYNVKQPVLFKLVADSAGSFVSIKAGHGAIIQAEQVKLNVKIYWW